MKLDLWIDADDTLWENNIFFERVFDQYIELLHHSTLTPLEIRDELDRIEHVNNKLHGYGAGNFVRNLIECFHRLSERAITPEMISCIEAFRDELVHHPLELIDGVEETLGYLADRHHLTLCTKGDPQEQQAKIDRSGLSSHFHHVRIVREKDADCYRAIAAERNRHQDHCWMIGNSPKSDINAALEAGINAVYIPHPHTWHLEHMEVPAEHARLLVLEKFVQLKQHF